MPEISIVIAAHNEGDLLWRTVKSCRETCRDLDYEIVVADDASKDDSIEQLRSRFPEIIVYSSAIRLGVSPTKDRAAQHAQGAVLVFLDAHCKPEGEAIAQLARDVRELGGEAIVKPTIGFLDPDTWVNDLTHTGQGFAVELSDITCHWVSIDDLRPQGRFYETPCATGCCSAMSKWLYNRLWGFDRDMSIYGVEDLDFSVKSWLLGYPILHDPAAAVGHRFQKASSTYEVSRGHLVANQIRMAYKVLTPELWNEWLDSFRRRQDPDIWHRAWDIFHARRGTAEVERVYLFQQQQMDVISYARRFGLGWPNSPLAFNGQRLC